MSSGGGGSTTTSNNAPPPQFTAAFQDAVTRAQQVAGQPQQQYPGTPGSLVAGFSPDQQAAIGTIQNAQGIAAPFINAGAQEVGASTAPLTPTVQPYVDAATGYYNQAGAPVTRGDISRVENPFTQQVVNATQAEFDNQNAQRAAGIRGNAISSGAFGGDREGVAQGIAAGQEQLAQAPVIAGLNQTGFNTALQNAMQQKQLDLGAGQGTLAAGSSLLGADEAQRWLESQAGYGLGNLGNEALNSTLTGANAQLGVGGLEQQLAQENLNVPYSQFVAQQAYPFQSTGWLANIEEGLGSASGGTSSTTYPGPSTGSQIAGAGLAGAGILGQTGAFGNNGWLTGSGGLFSSGGGAADALAAGAQSAAVSDAFGSTAAGLFGFGAARGGGVPHRAAGGIMPVGAAPPMGAGVPGGAGIPDLSMDYIPSGRGGGKPLITGNYGSTSNSTGPDNSGAQAMQTIGTVAEIAAMFLRRGGSVPHRARGGIADFANDDFANDNRFEPPRKLASGGITVDIPQMPSSARGISFVPGGNGIAIPQFNVPGGSGAAPVSSGGLAGVNDYLSRTQAMAPSAASIAALAPPPFTMPMVAQTAAPMPMPVERFDPPSQGGQDSGGGGGGDSGGGGARRGGRVPHRPYGGALPAWAGGPPDISLPTAPDAAIGVADQHDDPADPVLDDGGLPEPPIPPGLPDTVVTAPHARHGMPPAGGIAAASLPEPPIPPDQAPGGGGIAAQTATTTPAQHDKPSSKWGEVLLAAGLGMMGGRSPNALTNIGQGGLEGLKFGEQQRMREEQAELRKLQQQDLAVYRQGTLNTRERGQDLRHQDTQDRLSEQMQLATVRAMNRVGGRMSGAEFEQAQVGEFMKEGMSRADAIEAAKGFAGRAARAQDKTDQGWQGLELKAEGVRNTEDYRQASLKLRQSGLDEQTVNNVMTNASRIVAMNGGRMEDVVAAQLRGRGNVPGNSPAPATPAAPAMPALRPGQKPTLNDFLGE